MSQACKSALLLILTIPDRRRKNTAEFHLQKPPNISIYLYIYFLKRTKLLTCRYCRNHRISQAKPPEIIKMRILCSAGCVYYSSCYNFKTLLFLTSQLSHSPWCQERLLVHPTKRSDLLLFLSLLKMFKHTVTLQPVDRLLHHHASQYGTSPTRCLSVLWSLKKKKEERKKKKKKKLHFQKRKSHSAEQI